MATLRCNDLELYRNRNSLEEILIQTHENLGLQYPKETYDHSMMIKTYQACPESLALLPNEKVQGEKEIFEVLGNSNLCTSCLGTMQLIDTPKFLDSITESVEKGGYDFDQFKFNIRTPLSINIRTLHKEILGLRFSEIADNELNEILKSHQLDVKTVLKWIMAPLLAQRLNVKSSPHCNDFCINVNFWNYSDTFEIFQPFNEYIQATTKNQMGGKKRWKFENKKEKEKKQKME